MRLKSKSTAQKLGEFRESLSKYYQSLRKSPEAPKPKPTTEQFSGYAKALAQQIEDDEARKHEKCNKTKPS